MNNNFKTTEIICLVCGKKTIKRKRKQRVQNFCSRQCANSRFLGKVGPNKGKKFPYHPRLDIRGKKPWNYGKKLPHMSGKNCHLWRGGKTEGRMKIQSSYEYRMWRRKVFERDNYTCVECKQRGGNKHAHHIKSFAVFPDLIFNVENGITLCVPCHKKTDSYMKKVH